MAVIRVFAVLAVAALLLAAGGAWWGWRELHTAVPLPVNGALVSVAPGEPFRVTAARLEAAGVVRHAWVLRLWARWSALDRLVRSGDYRFDEALSPLAVLVRLRLPSAALHRVTVPEGSTVLEVAELFAAAGFGGVDQFLCLAQDGAFLQRLDLPASGLEGYLFPDTYSFPWSTSPEAILTAMVTHFHEKTGPLQQARLDRGMSHEDLVTLASLIEKESAVAVDRALVSAVFHNRLRLRMPLQSDPTALYGTNRRGAPTAADLAAPSPYNTYLHVGLPPGPICNPGLAAMQAALMPAEVPYLYFVSRNDGTHVFSRTLQEHNRAVARFQRGTARQRY